MINEEFQEEALLINQVVTAGHAILIEPGKELDWDGNRFPYRVTILSNGDSVVYEEGHKIGLCLNRCLDKISGTAD